MDGMSFSDLGTILNVLKENPAALQMLSGILSAGAQNPQPKPQPKPDVPNPSFDPSALSAIMKMLGSSGTSEPPKPPKIAPVNQLSGIFGSQEEIKNRIVLLNAVRPYLSETRKERLEAVIKLLRLAELGGLASLLN